MKIPFDIKFRPQIESGEYKVVTGDDRLVKIISWDKKAPDGRYDIVALVPTSQGDIETVQVYCSDGTLLASSLNKKFKLFLLTPEPELTEFEATLLSYLSDDTSGELDKETMHKCVKARAAELLKLAKKNLTEIAQYKSPLSVTYANRCFENGKQAMKEQMMKDAVEGTVMDFSSNRPRPQVNVLLDSHKYHTGDKVRIIIVKEE